MRADPRVMDGGCGCAAPLARRAFLAGLVGIVTAACAGPGTEAARRRQRELVAQAASAMGDTPVVDLHAHPGEFSRAATLTPGAIDDVRDAGVGTAFFCAVADGPVIRRFPEGIRAVRDPRAGELHGSTLAQLERVRERVRQGRLRAILAPGDLAAARRDGVPGALLACEGGDALEGQAGRVREFHELGVRSIQLLHYRVNELGDIQTEAPVHHRLTPAGAAVVEEMNRLGMIVDGAHASPATLRGILDVSRAPIIVSHTGPSRLRLHARHLDDDLLRAVAVRGGVVGVWPLARPTETVETFFQYLEYVRTVAGVEHVGVGTDMTGLATFTSIPTYRDFAPVPAALLARGYAEGDLRRLLGGNLVRVFETVARA